MTSFEGWRKSSYSDSGNPQCVEVGRAPGLVGVRDTKNREAGHIQVSRTAWAAFLRRVSH